MKHPIRTSRARRGMTMIEMAVTALVFSLMMCLLGIIVSTSHGAYRAHSLRSDLDARARRALARIAEELTTIQGSLMNPDPTGATGAATLDFQQAVGVVGGAVVQGPLMRVGFQYETGELDDGLDNDGDGLADEGVVELIRDVGGAGQMRVVLCRGVRELAEGEVVNGVDDNGNGVVDEMGFNLQRVGDVMVLRLWLEARGAGDPTVVRDNQATVRLRNVDI
jgi:prepilin-type N-terminal cleavage/methylation domain-containing protein